MSEGDHFTSSDVYLNVFQDSFFIYFYCCFLYPQHEGCHFLMTSCGPVLNACYIVKMEVVVMLFILFKYILLLNSDPAGAGVWSLCGLVGPGGPDV